MGKKSENKAPDYTPIGQASEKAAEMSAQVAREQLQWAKEQYAMDKATTDKVVDQFMQTNQKESDAAALNRERYQSVFQPLEDQLVSDAASYATDGRKELEASRAMADVSSAFEGQRQGALSALESFGVDPSTARSAALDSNLRISQAAAQAAAANQSRLNTENTARALRGEAINIGKGYPGNIASAYNTAQQAGSGAVGSALAQTASGAQTMGTATTWQGLQNSVLSSWGNQVSSMNNAETAANAQRDVAAMNMAGQAIGAVAGGAMAMM